MKGTDLLHGVMVAFEAGILIGLFLLSGVAINEFHANDPMGWLNLFLALRVFSAVAFLTFGVVIAGHGLFRLRQARAARRQTLAFAQAGKVREHG
jgi:hypothetical protein